MPKAQRRVFVGMHNVASYLSALEEGFVQIGYGTEHLSFDESYTLQAYVRSLSVLSRLCRTAWRPQEAKASKPRKLWFWLILRLYFGYCLLRCDIFVFTAWRSFFSPGNLRILRRWGKKVIFVFLGSDSRPCFLNGVRTNSRRGFAPKRAITHSRTSQERLATLTELVTAVIDNPASGQMHMRSFYSHNVVGFPSTLAASTPQAVGMAMPRYPNTMTVRTASCTRLRWPPSKARR